MTEMGKKGASQSTSTINRNKELPPWVKAVCSRAFLEAYEAGETIDFSCYEPAFLRHTATSTKDKDTASVEARHFFPPLLSLVLSENVAEAAAMVDAAELRRRKAAAHMDWENVTLIEEIWEGPALSSKVPPAVDYERLLLDKEENDDDDDGGDTRV